MKERWEHLTKYKRLPLRIGWDYTSLSHYDVEDGCPIKLEPGTSHSVMVSDEVLERVLDDATERRLIGVVQDALRRKTYSRVFEMLPKQPPEKLEDKADEGKALIDKKNPAEAGSVGTDESAGQTRGSSAAIFNATYDGKA